VIFCPFFFETIPRLSQLIYVIETSTIFNIVMVGYVNSRRTRCFAVVGAQDPKVNSFTMPRRTIRDKTFSKMFDIKFQDEKGGTEIAWGLKTGTIDVMVMEHGDDTESSYPL
jgi:hypothetical protein